MQIEPTQPMNAKLNQILCWNCEELVHRYALKCPYCKADLKNDLPTQPSPTLSPSFGTKEIHSDVQGIPPFVRTFETTPVTHLPEELNATDKLVHQPDLIDPSPQEPSLNDSAVKFPFWQDAAKIVFPVTLLLSGSVFFFFSLILKLFSQNGELAIRWDASNWPYFFIPSLMCIALGWMMLPNLDKD